MLRLDIFLIEGESIGSPFCCCLTSLKRQLLIFLLNFISRNKIAIGDAVDCRHVYSVLRDSLII